MLLSLCPYHCEHSLHCPIEQELEWLDKEADWNPQIMSFCPLIIILSTLITRSFFCSECRLVDIHTEHSTFTMCVYSKRSIHILLSQTYFLPVFYFFQVHGHPPKHLWTAHKSLEICLSAQISFNIYWATNLLLIGKIFLHHRSSGSSLNGLIVLQHSILWWSQLILWPISKAQVCSSSVIWFQGTLQES